MVMTISTIFQGKYVSEAITDSASKAGLTSLVKCRRASTDKERLAEFRGSVSQLHWDLSSDFTPIYRIPLLSKQYPHFNITKDTCRYSENLGI